MISRCEIACNARATCWGFMFPESSRPDHPGNDGRGRPGRCALLVGESAPKVPDSDDYDAPWDHANPTGDQEDHYDSVCKCSRVQPLPLRLLPHLSLGCCTDPETVPCPDTDGEHTNAEGTDLYRKHEKEDDKCVRPHAASY